MSRRTIRYVPPSPEVIDHFAQTVGRSLGAEYATPEVVLGLADFMTVVARVLANDLNRQQASEFDTQIE